jgi:uncharacterized protein YjbI with pentapeptide repeats
VSEPTVPPQSGALSSQPLLPGRPVLRPIPRWVIAVGVPVMVLVAVATVWLLLGFGISGDRLDAIRTGGTLGVGLGGVVVLWLAVRRQRSTELDLLNKYEAHRLAERVAAHNEAVAAENRAHQQQVAEAAQGDAVERRITELYTRAADQLGSDKAPVRLAGLYALERLAQDTARLRQTIVNVICAYLRMPYTLPTTANVPRPLGRRRKIRPGQPVFGLPPHSATPRPVPVDAVRQEREVRLTAQTILADHLRPDQGSRDPGETFWGDIDLDLTDATLINFDLRGCHVGIGRFQDAQFVGETWFDGAVFAGPVWFFDANFTGQARFVEATFGDEASFGGANFAHGGWFNGTKFGGHAKFSDANFVGGAGFDGAVFAGPVWVGGARFGSSADFKNALFTDTAAFGDAEFVGDTWFDGAVFAGEVSMHGTFARHAGFEGVQFDRGVPSELAHFVRRQSNPTADDNAE